MKRSIQVKEIFIVKVSGSSLRMDVLLEQAVITGIECSVVSAAFKYRVTASSRPICGLQGLMQALLDGRAGTDSLRYAASGTVFQQRVWDAACSVPYGSTATYGEIAQIIGCGSARAVGQALRANPVPLLIPCHRIVGAGGKLTGFSSGIEIKRLLLRHEHENCSGK